MKDKPTDEDRRDAEAYWARIEARNRRVNRELHRRARFEKYLDRLFLFFWLLAIGAFALLALAGCAMRVRLLPEETRLEVSLGQTLYSMEFVDVDGTWFASDLSLAPFSTLGADATSLDYDWTPEGAGGIAVGRNAREIDQTAQVEALSVIIKAAMDAAVRIPTGV